MKDEPYLIEKLLASKESSKEWLQFRSLNEVLKKKTAGDHAYVIRPKLRYINPYVEGKGRLADFDSYFKENLRKYLETDFSYPISGVYPTHER